MTNVNERTNTLLYKNISLTLYSRKGWCWLCVRGELETGTDCYILTPCSSDHSSTSFTFWLGHWGPKALSVAGSQFGILSPTDSNWNWPKLSVAPSYIIVSRPPTSAVLPLIYTGASLDWRLGRGSIYNNHPIPIFQNSTCGIFLHICLHTHHTHILQIMLKDNNSKKNKKKLLEPQQKNKILIRKQPSHYVTLAQANYYLNLFHTILCAVGYPDMRASQYNTDTSFILPNTIGPSTIPWRISKP